MGNILEQWGRPAGVSEMYGKMYVQWEIIWNSEGRHVGIRAKCMEKFMFNGKSSRTVGKTCWYERNVWKKSVFNGKSSERVEKDLLIWAKYKRDMFPSLQFSSSMFPFSLLATSTHLFRTEFLSIRPGTCTEGDCFLHSRRLREGRHTPFGYRCCSWAPMSSLYCHHCAAPLSSRW